VEHGRLSAALVDPDKRLGEEDHVSDQLPRVEADPHTAEMFRQLAELVYASDDFGAVYDAIVHAAPSLVEGCDHASLMLTRNGRLTTVAASDEVAAQIDSFERELGDGPCIDAIANADVYHDADLTDGSPWPRLHGRVLAQTPVRGMAGFQLRSGDDHAGALNVFSDREDRLTEASVHQGMVLASFVTVTLLAAAERQSARSLRAGLQSNREIGKAMGLMMAFHKIGDEEAFAMLRSTSQDLNIKLVDVARQVLDHHNNG
jgi:ANTAR domain/GAF domain